MSGADIARGIVDLACMALLLLIGTVVSIILGTLVVYLIWTAL